MGTSYAYIEGEKKRRNSMLTKRETLKTFLAVPCCSSSLEKSPEIQEECSIVGLTTGFNLPDQFYQNGRLRADIAALRKLRTTRISYAPLPLPAEMFLPALLSFEKISSRFDNINRIIYHFLDSDYTISLDMHPQNNFKEIYRTNYIIAHQKLIMGWHEIATSIKLLPDNNINVELLNEPTVPDHIWRPFSEILALQARQQLPKNRINIGPEPFQTIEDLEKWTPLAEINIIYAYHYYDLMNFTHQGATWDESNELDQISDIHFPIGSNTQSLQVQSKNTEQRGKLLAAKELQLSVRKVSNIETIKSQFTRISEWKTKHQFPVLINKYGVLRCKVMLEDRLNWLESVRIAAEMNGMGGRTGTMTHHFGLLDVKCLINAGVMHALMGKVSSLWLFHV
jgi:endoglucanase